MIFPTCLDPDFLSAEDIERVKEFLFNNKSDWYGIENTPLVNYNTHTVGTDPDRHFAHFYGPSLYSMQGTDDAYRNYIELIEKYNKPLLTEFYPIYHKMADAIGKALKADAGFCPHTNMVPGFHIFGNGLDEKVDYDYFYDHTDDFPIRAVGGFPPGEIYSLIIPIQIPETGACLEYKKYDETYHRYNYKVGSLSMWSGKMPHRIGHFTLSNKNDYRITWQIHVSLREQTGIIFW